MRQLLGLGANSEQVELERVHEACWLVHCEGNSESPFKFSSEVDARQFADLLTMERLNEL